MRFWREVVDPQLSRGRRHHKNDQRFVEQKNASCPSQLLLLAMMLLRFRRRSRISR